MALPSEEIKEKLNLVDFLRGYLDLRPAGKNFKANCPFHSDKSPSFIVSPERQIWHCFGCFPPGQKVKTPFGYHNIEDLDENHYVYSDSGNIRKILATHKRHYEGKIVNVKVRKLNETVSLTTDHKLKIIRPKTSYYKKSKQFYRQVRNYGSSKIKDLDLLKTLIEKKGEKLEITAGELRLGDFVMYPINNRVADLKKINLKDFLQKKHRFGPVPAEIPYEVKINQDFLKLVGYYIAEGSNHRAYIRFSLGNHEKDFADEITGLIKTIFGLTAKVYMKKERNGLEITACHSLLADIFGNLCGKGANQKHIPFIFGELPPDKQMVLLKAIHRGDGYSYITNRSSKKHQAITTVSRILAEQITDFLLRNDIFPTLSVSKAKIDKLNVNHKEIYVISWSKEAISQHSLVYKDAKGSRYWLLPVRSIKKEPYKGYVYNLTVDKDHSYITPTFAVGNCGEGGDIFKFLMKYENLEFYEALKILAEKAGIELSRLSPTDQKQFGILYDINRIAAEFYKSKLAESERGQSYLAERKLNEETIQEFEIGFAPQGFDALHMHLIKSGFSVTDTVRAGLIFKTERGQYMDRFRGRVMFPIHNHFGKVVGFSGRILPELDNGEMGKYINSPETPIFKKSRLLYGFFKAKNFIRESKTIVLVEGQMDFLMLWQDGVKNAAASSGTALTPEHLKNLRRIADRIILGFDSDAAGLLAAERAIDLAGGEDFSVFVLSLKGSAIENEGTVDYKDPAEVVQNKPGLIIKYIEKSKPAMEHYFSRYIRTGGSENTKQDIRIILSKIRNLWSKIDQARWFRELSYRTGISERELSEELEQIEESRSDRASDNEAMAPRLEEKKALKRSELITERLLSLISVKDEFKSIIQTHIEFMPNNYRIVYKAMSGSEIKTREMEGVLAMIDLQSSRELDNLVEEGKLYEEFKNLLRELELEYLKEQQIEISRQITIAESLENEDIKLKKMEESVNISKRIQKLKNGKES